ncbi:HTH-type transcriptional regulator / antitoxin HigA [Parapedobacter luteus]|uniref:HTH-type transcriptional regulator / antitoxin HigA n=1 Tax=Parapedobacter luteus TaxID=623280 RepID=A0A1T5FJ43_9SPHI|nr:helix-turn-helix domain-containing protein [Parapedobacter luteus]SKB96096.1 HTH-type transcriptional regulator / antitoxin HigA [Parapedobacter luteus]
MATLKYSVIKDKAQYDTYCKELETLLEGDPVNYEEVELLTLLIEHYDTTNNSFKEMDPIELLKSLMKDHDMRPKDLVNYLGISKGYISDILNYKKGLSKEVIRKLASRFNLSQEAFNRPYKLHVPENRHFRNASMMNFPKEIHPSLV